MSTATVTKLKRKAADFEQKKQLDKALALYIQIVDEGARDLDDADLQIYNRVGDLLMRQSNVSEALAYWEKAVDVYAERGFLSNAIALCTKILRQSPARTSVYYKLGKISARQGFKSDARKNFLEYADRMQKGGNIDEAFRALKEFADLCPEQDDIRLFLADLLTKEQRTDEAVEQLEQLYSKLAEEGRSAEARATLDRIKAIDPDITPRASGSFIAQKPNDLVFLDLNEPMEAPLRSSPLSITPVADPPEAIDVTGVGALEGLAITFFPGEASNAADAPEPPSVDGLELNVVTSEGQELGELAHLDIVESLKAPATDPLEGIEIDATASPEDLDLVTPVDGLATIATTITDTHPSLAPLLDAPPMSGAEFSHLELDIADAMAAPRPHDLALPSSLPRLVEGTTATAAEDSTSHDTGLVRDVPDVALPVRSTDAGDAPTSEPLDSGRRATPADRELDLPAFDVAAGPTVSESELAAVQSAHESEHVEAGNERSGSALDTSTLNEGSRRAMSPSPRHDAPNADQIEGTSKRSSFEEDRVELPMIDLEAQANADSDLAAFDAGNLPPASIDDLLSAPPTFGDSDDNSAFEPSPLDLTSDPSTEEWEAPEVLIDGEWRDEHVGNLASGEMFVIGERREATRGPNDGGTFDDLAAAMLYDEGDADNARDAAAGAFAAGTGRRSTLSFGGSEAQLRQRLDKDPGNAGLRRQLGEALLDDGLRDEGLHELELALQSYEAQAVYPSAREIVDVILRVSPQSVHHHQKRVEYAARSNDRVQLIGAYTELADALFRCGESDKSRVVYARVLDLDPHSDRARFALGLLSDAPEPTRRSDEIPSIDTGLPPLPGAGILENLRTGTITGIVTDERVPPAASTVETASNEMRDTGIAGATPTTTAGTAAAPWAQRAAAVDPALDEEVDAAFDEAHATPRSVTPALPVSAPESFAPEDVVTSTVDVAALRGDTFPDANEFIDLGEWLRASEPSRSTRMVVDDVAPTGDENADFAEMLRRFKQGVAENVEDEDYDSHYDLGVAFKEMGLIDEAVAEFQKALRGADHRVRAYEALGQCFVEQGRFQVATTLLRRALESTAADDQRLVGVLYLLGYASETMGRHGDAVGYYQRVFAVDIEFRDVSSRLAALDRKTQ